MFVYMTTNLINGKKYIGKYEGKETDNYLGSGKLLRRAIEKHGKHNFQRIILEYYNTIEETRAGEIYWIDKYNAVASREFYNIAAGGEGGNTFAGILGEDRNHLINKLKQRKRPDPRPNFTTCIDLLTNICISVHINEYKKLSNLVGQRCTGLYITPYGNFSSRLTMSNSINIDMTSLVKKCTKNDTTIRRSHLQGVDMNSKYYHDLQKNIGNTFKDIGYNFIPINDILYKDLDFYKKLNIIK